MKYNLKADHREIKEQIKSWEIRLDHIINAIIVDEPVTEAQKNKIANTLEVMSHEMMAINI
jgi:hypothetical protein